MRLGRIRMGGNSVPKEEAAQGEKPVNTGSPQKGRKKHRRIIIGGYSVKTPANVPTEKPGGNDRVKSVRTIDPKGKPQGEKSDNMEYKASLEYKASDALTVTSSSSTAHRGSKKNPLIVADNEKAMLNIDYEEREAFENVWSETKKIIQTRKLQRLPPVDFRDDFECLKLNGNLASMVAQQAAQQGQVECDEYIAALTAIKYDQSHYTTPYACVGLEGKLANNPSIQALLGSNILDSKRDESQDDTPPNYGCIPFNGSSGKLIQSSQVESGLYSGNDAAEIPSINIQHAHSSGNIHRAIPNSEVHSVTSRGNVDQISEIHRGNSSANVDSAPSNWNPSARVHSTTSNGNGQSGHSSVHDNSVVSSGKDSSLVASRNDNNSVISDRHDHSARSIHTNPSPLPRRNEYSRIWMGNEPRICARCHTHIDEVPDKLHAGGHEFFFHRQCFEHGICARCQSRILITDEPVKIETEDYNELLFHEECFEHGKCARCHKSIYLTEKPAVLCTASRELKFHQECFVQGKCAYCYEDILISDEVTRINSGAHELAFHQDCFDRRKRTMWGLNVITQRARNTQS